MTVKGSDEVGLPHIDGSEQSDETVCSAWKSKYGKEGSNVYVRIAAVLKPGVYDADEYDGYYESMNRAIDAVSPALRFRR